MAAYQCLNCHQIEDGDEACCDAPDLFCINDMPGEIVKLRAALAQQAEPVGKPEGEQPAGVVVGFTDEGRAIVDHDGLEEGWVLYTTPPQRKPLTEEELRRIFVPDNNIRGWARFQHIARAIERAHGIPKP